MIITVLSYLVTLSAVHWAFTGMLQSVFGGLIGRILGANLGMFIGAVITWEIIDWLWRLIDGNHLPITVLLGSIALLISHAVKSRDELNSAAKLMMSAEQWVLIILGIYLIVSSDPVRWY